jgi:hypothetical protein
LKMRMNGEIPPLENLSLYGVHTDNVTVII